MYLTIVEAAKFLRMKPSTVRHKIKTGLIVAQRLGGFTSPLRIDATVLQKTMAGLDGTCRDMEIFDRYGPKTVSEEMQYDELTRRLTRLKSVLGNLNAVRPLLEEFGAHQIDDLHPRHYPSFRGKLMRLTRGLNAKRVPQPYLYIPKEQQ